MVLQAGGSSAGGLGLKRPITTDDRLILDLYLMSWCGTPVILLDELIETVPFQLAVRGVSQPEWTQWMTRLRQDLLNNWTPMWKMLLIGITVIGIPYGVHLQSKKTKAMLQFAEDINNHLLRQKNMILKPQVGSRPDGKYAVPWLSIALNSDECARLADEPYNMRTEYTSNNFVTDSYQRDKLSKCCTGHVQVVL